jgi:hypothetical protein
MNRNYSTQPIKKMEGVFVMSSPEQENKINNSYFIRQEFHQRSQTYHPPLLKKRKKSYGRSGKPKIYTPEEIQLYLEAKNE